MGNVIGSLSLGATRNFRIRHNKTKETTSFEVAHGTLIVMAGTMQQFWKHWSPLLEDVCWHLRVRLGIHWIYRKSEFPIRSIASEKIIFDSASKSGVVTYTLTRLAE
jgi:hypothetical protein